MKRLSSGWTVFHKRVLPLVCLVGLVALAVDGISKIASGQGRDLPTNIGPIVLIGTGFLLFRRNAADLVDEVRDAGEAIVVRRRKVELRIPLRDIVQVRYNVFYPQVTLILRAPGALGGEVTFVPLDKLIPWTKHEAILGLMSRVEGARAG